MTYFAVSSIASPVYWSLGLSSADSCGFFLPQGILLLRSARRCWSRSIDAAMASSSSRRSVLVRLRPLPPAPSESCESCAGRCRTQTEGDYREDEANGGDQLAVSWKSSPSTPLLISMLGSQVRMMTTKAAPWQSTRRDARTCTRANRASSRPWRARDGAVARSGRSPLPRPAGSSSPWPPVLHAWPWPPWMGRIPTHRPWT